MIYIIDIESNNLLANMLTYKSFPYKLNEDAKLWCVSIRNYKTNEVTTLVGEDITKENMEEALKGATYIVAHNGIKFDFISLKLFGVFDYHIGYIDQDDTLFGNKVIFIDTLILSRLFNPSRYGGHSLGVWGERLGEPKTDFRQLCIDQGYIDKNAPKGEEFKKFCPEMIPYCEQDTETTAKLLTHLSEVKREWDGWDDAIKMENKLADLGMKREHLGFAFDKEAAIECVEDLTEKMKVLEDRVNPILPPKPLNKTEENFYTPPKNQLSTSKIKDTTPPKNQIKNDGELTSAMIRFIEKHNITFENGMLVYEGREYEFPLTEPLITEAEPSEAMLRFVENSGGEIRKNKFYFKGKEYKLPMECKPIVNTIPSSISDLDHVKQYLIELGWHPSEWRVRDLTKDSKKQSISFEKRVKALERWIRETFEQGKYREKRLQELDLGRNPDEIFDILSEKLHADFPVRVPTSPSVRVGVEKELCPNLEGMGSKVDFAKDFTLYLTYKHRKASIAGGDVEDMDFDKDTPNTGYLSVYREEDFRVPCPAIEIGAVSNRLRHISIANVARATSLYGKEMRSLFGCGEGFVQLGFDFNSLENRVQGGHVLKYKGGKELAETLLAEKPNDLHSVNARKLGISRSDAKSFGYAVLYGASPKKLASMLNVSPSEGKRLYDEYWKAVPALKELKDNVTAYWENTDKTFIRAIDGRKLLVRSPHSILNTLFQGNGVISAKYTAVYLFSILEEQGYCTNCFENKPDIGEMIFYHDEMQLAVNQPLIKFKTFETEEDALDFVANWKGNGQLSSIKKENKWYVALPSPVSLAIEEATIKAEKKLNLQFKLAFEYDVHKNWYGCH